MRFLLLIIRVLNTCNETRITLGRKLRSITGLHAELAVLYKAKILTDEILKLIILNKKIPKIKLKSKNLFVIRIKKDCNNFILAESTPCSLCRKVLMAIGIKKIIYIDYSGIVKISHPKLIISKLSSGIITEKIICKKTDIIHKII